jgi:hypothetical protein
MKKLVASIGMVFALAGVSIFAAGSSNVGLANGSVAAVGVASGASNGASRYKRKRLKHPKPARPLKHHKIY